MRTFVAFLLSLVAAVSLSSTPAHAADEMSADRAGEVYLRGICNLNQALDRWEKVIWHGRKTIPNSEVKRRLPELRRVTKPYARALGKFASKLFNPPTDWPSNVARQVKTMAQLQARASGLRARQVEAASASEWSWLHSKAIDLPTTQVSAQIRARLSLPPPGQGC